MRGFLLSLFWPLAAFLLQPVTASENRSIRALSLAAPSPESVPRFVSFINEELGARKVNALLLRIDYNFDYRSHPELVAEGALTLSQAKKIVAACRSNGIRLIPQINLLGHQSWASQVGKLLEVYPQFDETPHIQLPEVYQWPNEDGLYCKSYCPLHPDVHDVVFSLVDEVMDAFEATDFHAGMDEVFYIGDPHCPRCSGKDPSELFAGEVEAIRKHLARKGHRLWIWGDRLLDGVTTGLGEWEASTNDTHRAIELISREVVICDWHYEKAEPTAAYFALKGFSVLTCAWNQASVSAAQLSAFHHFKANANPTLANRYLGLMQTVWSSTESFLNRLYGNGTSEDIPTGDIESFNTLFPRSIEKP